MLLKDKLNMLTDKLSFVLGKNKELRVAQQNYFDSILPIIDKKLKDKQLSEKTIADLKEIQSILQKDRTLSLDEFDQDLKFLQEQLDALNQIKTIEDPKKAETILNMMFEGDFEETGSDKAEFQEKISADFELAITNLNLLLEELKESIEDEDLTEIKLLLQTNLEEAEEDMEECGCCSDCDECDHEQDCQEGLELFKEVSEEKNSSCCNQGCCSGRNKK